MLINKSPNKAVKQHASRGKISNRVWDAVLSRRTKPATIFAQLKRLKRKSYRSIRKNNNPFPAGIIAGGLF